MKILVDTILDVLDEHKAVLETGALIVVEPFRSRIRILPLKR